MVASTVNSIDLEQFDLIFIDDSMTGEERCATIRIVAEKQPRRAVVVVHDFEHLPYRTASRPFRHRYRFTGLNPNTGLLWNDDSIHESQLRSLDRRLRLVGEQPSVVAWDSVLSSFGRSLC